MERNINDVNREPFTLDFIEPFGQRLEEIRAAGFFSDLTKKLVSSAAEKAASAIGAKAGEALGNKLFNRPLFQRGPFRGQKKKPKILEEASKAAPAVEENKGTDRDVSRSLTPSSAELGGNELVKLLQVENKLRGAAPQVSQSNIYEIYNRLLSDE